MLTTFLQNAITDPEDAHRVASMGLKLLGMVPTLPFTPLLPRTVFGIEFKNPVGLAAGFDKEGKLISGLEQLGFGFIEIGTVTKYAQPGNPRPRIFRPQPGTILNRMGFNNSGADAVRARLLKTKRSIPIGISLGKSKVTDPADAAGDYLYSFQTLYKLGDYFVINVSSPNTPGLRNLQDKVALTEIVRALNNFRKQQSVRRPLLVKIAPDLSDEQIHDVLQIVQIYELDGVIATNTLATKEGGLSGVPLRERSTEVIRFIHTEMPQLPIIGVGGIFTAEDAYDKLQAGASLVQLYTGMVYGGPLVPRKVVQGLVTRFTNK